MYGALHLNDNVIYQNDSPLNAEVQSSQRERILNNSCLVFEIIAYDLRVIYGFREDLVVRKPLAYS